MSAISIDDSSDNAVHYKLVTCILSKSQKKPRVTNVRPAALAV